MTRSIFSVSSLPRGSGASVAAIEDAESALGMRLPEDYRAFLLESDGVEGFIAPGRSYLMLWSASTIPEAHVGYKSAEFIPGVVLVGSDGGGEAYGFRDRDGRVEYVRIPFINAGVEEAEPMGATLAELVERLRDEP